MTAMREAPDWSSARKLAKSFVAASARSAAALRLMVVSAPCGADGPNASSASSGSTSVASSRNGVFGA